MKKNWRIPVLAVGLAGTLALSAGAAAVVRHTSWGETPACGGRAYTPLIDLEAGENSGLQAAGLSAQTAYPQELTLDKLSARVKEAEQSVQVLKPAESPADRRGQYRQLNQTITLLAWDVEAAYVSLEADLRDGLVTTAVYNAQYDGLTELEDRLGTVWEELAGKTLDSTVTGVQAAADPYYLSLQAQLETLDDETGALAQQAQSSGTADAGQSLQAAQRLDRLEEAVELAYRGGKIDAAQYQTLDTAAGQVEDRLKLLHGWCDDGWTDHSWCGDGWSCRNGDHGDGYGCYGYGSHSGYGHDWYGQSAGYGYDHGYSGHNSHSGGHRSGHHG